ncbi:MAG: PEP-CTERM sorting domain-containing protein [Gallionella sp.]|nr:MAG: PEP-CTERM sorting domain-containing protein [Gallionella sp.]
MSKKSQFNKSRLALPIAAAALLASGAVAAAPTQVLLDENFQGVTGLGAATTVRTVQDILANNPGQLGGAPLASFANTGDGDADDGNASAAAFNVRRGDNAIDGSSGPANFGDTSFDNFFGAAGNLFLVIGDNSGHLGGLPNGGDNTTASSTMSIQFTLDTVILSSPRWLDIAFDYVFDSNNISNPDSFVAELILADASTVNLLNFGAPSVSTRGAFSLLVPYATLAAAPSSLNFRLVEGTGNDNSAVGLDNLKVTVIPEPGALTLLGIGLLGLGAMRKRPT